MTLGDVELKLRAFLERATPFSEESQVVYLLVELRKMLEHRRSRAFPTIRFYSDWAVHTRKDRLTPDIKTAIADLLAKTTALLEAGRDPVGDERMIVDNLRIQNLRDEIVAFLSSSGINTGLHADANWVAFVSNLVPVLVNQPIMAPTRGVEEFRLVATGPRRLHARITFTERIKHRAYVDLKWDY